MKAFLDMFETFYIVKILWSK